MGSNQQSGVISLNDIMNAYTNSQLIRPWGLGGGAIKWLVNKDVAGEPQMNRGGQNKAALHYIK